MHRRARARRPAESLDAFLPAFDEGGTDCAALERHMAGEDDSFDVAGSELRIMLFPDRMKGLKEMARVVKPGGRGVMIVFGPPPRVPAVSMFFDAAQTTIPGFVPPAHSPLFCLQDPDVLRHEMEQAGFQDVRVESLEGSLQAESEARLWDNLIAGAPALAGVIEGASTEHRQAVRETYLNAVRTRFGAKPFAIPMTFNLGVATKPIR